MTGALEFDALWETFHRVVSMTSREPADRLRVRDADESTEPLPEEAGTPTGQHVLSVPQKRRTSPTDDDLPEVQRAWPEVAPYPDDKALSGAQRPGPPEDRGRLVELAGDTGPAVLAAAPARAALDRHVAEECLAHAA